ncbi:MAG: SGNH/GDSL hydrolase family protein [Thermodesulfobacteriota bacterium]
MIKILALGDSYTIGEGVKQSDSWPMQLASQLRKDNLKVDTPQIIAVTGWTTTDLMSAIEKSRSEQRYDLVTLLIWVNDQFQGYSEESYGIGFNKLLAKAIELAGGRPNRVIVISIPDYIVTPFGKRFGSARIRAEIDKFNEINKEIATENRVHYVNVTEISRRAAEDPTLLAPDGLHPSAKMYAEWVELTVPVTKSMLEESNNG